MEFPTNNESMLHEKYEALLNGVIPESFKDHILYDKISFLQRQNNSLENTILSLRHELSNQVAKHERILQNSPEKASKYFTISSALQKTLDISEIEISQFSEVYSKAVAAVKKSNDGFSLIMSSMKSKLFPPNETLLECMGGVMEQVNEIRGELEALHNYISILEYNDSSLRQSLNSFETRPSSNRSKSTIRNDPFEQPGRTISKRFTRTLVSDSPSTKNSMEFKNEDVIAKINTLKIALGKVRNQRDQLDIENQKLLLQLKQAKEQLALSEENAAAKEVAYENQIRKLNFALGRLKPNNSHGIRV